MRCLRATLLSLFNFLTPNFSTSSFLTPNLLAVAICSLTITTFSFAAPQDRILGPIVSQQQVQLPTGVPLKAQAQYDQGPVDPALKLTYMTLLTAPSVTQHKALDRLLAQQQDRRSPLYHKWLTPEQYADRFGLSRNDILKICTWLTAQGFTVLNVAPSRNLIAFSGTAAQVAGVFQTEVHNFNVNGEKHYSNVRPPSIPTALSDVVVAIGGLNDFRPKPHNIRHRPDYTINLHGSVNYFLAPDDIATTYDITALYNLAPAIDGTGQKLAVIGQTDIYLADINDFRSGFGLSTIPTTGAGSCTTDTNGVITVGCNTTNLRYVLVGTENSTPFLGDLGEADLDIEWSGATARNAQIIYVNSPNGNGVWDAWHAAVTGNIAPVISMSYGLCELGEVQNGSLAADEGYLQQANAQGITFLNSSGDSGAASCDPPFNNPSEAFASLGLAVAYPASSPEVTGVGGTMIPLGEYTSQYWNPNNGANGGSIVSGVNVPENAWNDSTEFGALCTADPTNGLCTFYGIKDAETAQAALGMASTGGGASNCTATDANGACSSGFARPTWQQSLNVPGQSAAVRFVPDVSLLASANLPGYIWCTPVEELSNTPPYSTETSSSCASGIAAAVSGVVSGNNYVVGPSIVGGTSASSPVFAGIVTLLNQYVVQNNFQTTAGLGNINPTLYQIATYNQAAFHQVTGGLNAPGGNQIYCQPNTPVGQNPALICPAAVKPATEGRFGYLSANADLATGYNLAVGLGSVDVNNLANAWGELFTATTTSLAASPIKIIPGGNDALTITVTPSAASGVVKLYNNGSTTPLGSASISGGAGTFNTTALPLGTNSITGTFVGIFASSTSAPVIVNVIAPDFAVANTSTTSPTVLAGVSATGYTFAVTPLTFGPTFAATVTFSCSGLDATMGCVFNPPTIAAGTSGTQTVALTITTAGPNQPAAAASQHKRAENRSPWLPLTIPIAGVVIVGLVGRKASRTSAIAIAMCITLAFLGLLIACGGSSAPVTVGISPPAASLWPNNMADGWPSSTQAFTASVGNTRNTAVTWSISPSAAGSIDANGNYTAPTVAAGLPASVSVTATSQADSSKTATSVVSLKKASVPGAFNATVTVIESVTTHTVGPYTLTVE